MRSMKIVEFGKLSNEQLQRAAELLVDAFNHAPSAWGTIGDATVEVATFIGNPERIGFAALDDSDLRGWIGGLRYTPHAWELHPLAVDPKHQGQGIGTALVAALEMRACEEGVSTLWLGSDDDFGGTNLYAANVFPNVLEHLAQLAPATGHPFTFYRQLGYSVVGLLPDVNGFGKPDILMAKRIANSRPPSSPR